MSNQEYWKQLMKDETLLDFGLTSGNMKVAGKVVLVEADGSVTKVHIEHENFPVQITIDIPDNTSIELNNMVRRTFELLKAQDKIISVYQIPGEEDAYSIESVRILEDGQVGVRLQSENVEVDVCNLWIPQLDG